MLTKKLLRQQVLKQRASADREHLTHLCLNHFKEWFSTKKAQTIASYQPILALHEYNMPALEEIIKNQITDCTIAYPKVENEIMTFYSESAESQWVENKWNILELENGNKINPHDIDLVICPLLVVDQNGYRLGYGKGFYDYFIPLLAPQCIIMGIGIFEPISEIPEIFPHDEQLDLYISPCGIHYFL